jgi:hypothetical protein
MFLWRRNSWACRWDDSSCARRTPTRSSKPLARGQERGRVGVDGTDQSPTETAAWRHPVPAAQLLAQLPNPQIEKLGNHFEQAVWNKRLGQQGDPQVRRDIDRGVIGKG